MLVSELLTELKRRLQMQAAQTVLSDADLVAIANQQLHGVIVPKLLAARQNYFQCQQYYTLSASQRRYRAPFRAVGGRVNRVVLVENGEQTKTIPQAHSSELRTQGPTGFYMAQGKIVLVGQIPTGGMRVYYPILPPKMSSTAAAIGTVSSASASSFVYSGTAASSIQVISWSSPYRTLIVADDVNTDNTANDALDTNASLVGRVEQLDIVISRNSTHIVPLQDSLCDWLIERVALRVLQYLGHAEQAQMSMAKIGDMQNNIMDVYTPRSQFQPKVISNRDLTGADF